MVTIDDVLVSNGQVMSPRLSHKVPLTFNTR